MESNRHSIKTVIKHTKKRHYHHHRRTNRIRQKIELKKQHFQCVINLNTTICENEAHQSKLNTKIHTNYISNRSYHQSHIVSSIIREPISLKPQCYTRIAPYCFREKCRSVGKPCRCREIREQQDHFRDKMAKHHRHNNRQHREGTRESKLASRLPDRHHKHKNDSIKLSPISSSPLKHDDLYHLYEDISNDSLDKILETPRSYKNIKYVENKVESKLDTLIKRTKERERQQVAQSRSRPSYSISSISNMSSGECPMDLGSLTTISLQSRSTLVLEKSQSDFIYFSSESQEYSRSPQSEFTISLPRKNEHGELNLSEFLLKNDYNMNILKKYEHNQTYSPVSPKQNNFITNIPEKYEHNQTYMPVPPEQNDFIMNIPKKYEHNQTYMPVPPEQNDLIMNIPKKYEHNQIYSSISPEQNDFIMNIPKKYEHNQTFSPIPPEQNDFVVNIPKKYEHDCKIDNIKVEPIDIGIYSPNFDYSEEEINNTPLFGSGVKKEVKIKSETSINVMGMLNFNIKKEV